MVNVKRRTVRIRWNESGFAENDEKVTVKAPLITFWNPKVAKLKYLGKKIFLIESYNERQYLIILYIRKTQHG